MEYGRLGVPDPGGGGSASRSLTPDPTRTPKNSRLKFLLILAATLIVASVVSAALVVDVIRSRVDSGGSGAARLHSRRPSQAMSRACSRTRYPTLCVNSLLDFPGAVAASDKDLVHISVNMTLQKFGRALYVATEISNLNMDPRVRSAYEDCLELLEDSVDLLSRSLTSVAPGGGAAGSTQDVLTWLSASLTNQDTCTEGFDELNGYVKTQMSARLKDLSELVSNCLAIYAAASGDDDFSGIPIQNRRRRLMSNEKEHKHFPTWLSRRDRMLLDIPVAVINADIIVSKDGNGTYKTIAEAIKKAPEHSNRRIIIYVRAGKYEEDILKVGRKKTNLMFIGDGKGKTVISGGKSVQDNMTTFHTASFGKEIIQKGTRWLIGNGTTVQIWKDPWIPNQDNFRAPNVENRTTNTMTVRELMLEENNIWNEELVRGMFDPETAHNILNIPLRNTWGPDTLSWHFTSTGQYSVKSGYKLALKLEENFNRNPSHSGPPSSIWKWVWALNIPPKVQVFLWRAARGALPVKESLFRRKAILDPICKRCGDGVESIEHALRDCPWSSFFWRASPLRLDNLTGIAHASMADMITEISSFPNQDLHCLFALLLWSLWHSRNMFEFQEKKMTHQECFSLATRYLHEYQTTNDQSKPGQVKTTPTAWRCPPEGVTKINTDASILKMKGTGIGVAIRTHTGAIVHTLSRKFSQEFAVDVAEAIACSEGLHLAQRLQIQHVILETDCLRVVQEFNSDRASLTYLGSAVDEIRSLSSYFSSFTIKFIPRTANIVAHHLASFAFSHSCNGFYSGSCPTELTHLLQDG